MGKKGFLVFCMMIWMTAGALTAQVVKSKWTNCRWTSGDEVIAAHPLDGQKILMLGAGYMDAGYGWAFRVKQNAYNDYSLIPVPASQVKLPAEEYGYLGLNEPERGDSWHRQFFQGVDVVLVKNAKGEIKRVYAPLDPGQEMSNREEQMLCILLCGSFYDASRTYTSSDGNEYVFSDDGTCVFEGESMTYTFGYDANMPVPVVVLSNGSRYKYVVTKDGIDLFNVSYDEDEAMHEDGDLYASLSVDNSQPRWGILEDMVICNSFVEGVAPDALRIMRNEVWARHGYKFTDAALNQHFRSCPWYKPGTDNSKVKLSPVESLNVSLIKYVENHR